MAGGNSWGPPVDWLRTVLRYEPETGHLYWLKAKRGRVLGKPIGVVSGDSYRQVCINRQNHLQHRIIWLLQNGHLDSAALIDHINGDKTDNRQCNLRLATSAQNLWNRDAKSGGPRPRGVTYDTWAERYQARVKANGRVFRSRWFKSPEEAGLAYVAMVKEHHGEFTRVA